MSDDMSTLERLTRVAKAAGLALDSARQLEEAALLNRETDNRGGHGHAHITESLEHLVRRQGLVLCEQATEIAAQLGWQVATYEIAPMAKESGDVAVVFITGNSYMPPLREFGISEQVWQLAPDLTLADLWPAYVERLESRLDELRVYLGAPEYDNALYVVDLERFEYVEEPEEADSLDAEWRPIPHPPANT